MLRNTVIIFQFETTIYCYSITLTLLTKNQLSINKLIKEKQFTCKNQNINHKFELIIVLVLASIIFVTFFICFYHKNLHTLHTEHPNYILFPFFLSNKNGKKAMGQTTIRSKRDFVVSTVAIELARELELKSIINAKYQQRVL